MITEQRFKEALVAALNSDTIYVKGGFGLKLDKKGKDRCIAAYDYNKKREAKIREAPGRSAAELGTAGREVIFRKTGTQGDWVRVSHSQVDGWVHKSLVWP